MSPSIGCRRAAPSSSKALIAGRPLGARPPASALEAEPGFDIGASIASTDRGRRLHVLHARRTRHDSPASRDVRQHPAASRRRPRRPGRCASSARSSPSMRHAARAAPARWPYRSGAPASSNGTASCSSTRPRRSISSAMNSGCICRAGPYPFPAPAVVAFLAGTRRDPAADPAGARPRHALRRARPAGHDAGRRAYRPRRLAAPPDLGRHGARASWPAGRDGSPSISSLSRISRRPRLSRAPTPTRGPTPQGAGRSAQRGGRRRPAVTLLSYRRPSLDNSRNMLVHRLATGAEPAGPASMPLGRVKIDSSSH